MRRRTAIAVPLWIGGAISVVLVALLALSCELFPREADPPSASRRFVPADIPKIDVHVHVAPEQASRAVSLLSAHGVVLALNASGGHPRDGLPRSQQISRVTRGQLLPYCNLSFSSVEQPGWGAQAALDLADCKRLGAVGWKIFKGLGLGTTLSDGSLLRVDDPRLDPAFEAAGALAFPVLIHSGDPQAFFRAANEDNERIEELRAHPGWSFFGVRPNGGGPWPTWEDVYQQFERRVARHPGTTFVGAHFGNAPEDPDRVALLLESCPNLFIETGARIPEIGRHTPARMRAFFERFQDRILFGTDLSVTDSGLVLGSGGREPDPLGRLPHFFEAHYRYFETTARKLTHPTPIQGNWTIDGIGLARSVLEKLYWKNAVRVFALPVPASRRPPPPSG